jgi:hypothetical protein
MVVHHATVHKRTWGTSTRSAILTATSACTSTSAATAGGQGSLRLRQTLHKLCVARLQLQALRVCGSSLGELAVEEQGCA